MIGIMQNSNLTASYMKLILEKHLVNVSERVKNSHTCSNSDIDIDIAKFFDSEPKSFNDIMKATYEELKELKKKWDSGLKKGLKPTANYINLYDSWRKNHGNDLVMSLELSVCPYCNRNHINGSADFDHFFSKDKYPIFAVSLYNLIPVCAVCNRLKNNKSIDISPYDASKSTDDLLTFSYIPESVTTLRPIIKLETNEMSSNITVLKLEEAYSIHTELVAEIMYKATKYNEVYVDSLYDILGFTPTIDLIPKEFYYNNYLSQEKYYKRTLSKLTKDLVYEFEIR